MEGSILPMGRPVYGKLGDTNVRSLSTRACRRIIRRAKWPNGFLCSCGNRKASYLPGRKVYACSATRCGRQHSLLTGTIFAHTKKPLFAWFKVIQWIVTTTDPITTSALAEIASCSYRTASTWLTKFQEWFQKGSSQLPEWWPRLMGILTKLRCDRPFGRFGRRGSLQVIGDITAATGTAEESDRFGPPLLDRVCIARSSRGRVFELVIPWAFRQAHSGYPGTQLMQIVIGLAVGNGVRTGGLSA